MMQRSGKKIGASGGLYREIRGIRNYDMKKFRIFKNLLIFFIF